MEFQLEIDTNENGTRICTRILYIYIYMYIYTPVKPDIYIIRIVLIL